MKVVLTFFVNLTPVIFALLALGLIFSLRRLARSLSEERTSVFGLEREIAQGHVRQAVAMLVVISVLALSEFALVVFLVPNVPGLVALPTPTMNPLITPTGTFPLEFMETLGVVTPGGPTLTPSATGCIPGQIDITAPKPGSSLQKSVQLMGSANIPNFGFFKYEFAPLGSDAWVTILADNKVVQDGNLGSWDITTITPGDYQLRLVVSDNQGNNYPACVIPVRIIAP
ncbi:MAG TPA: hypothetical protein VMT91_12985 [Anaerolineales bacterium]|nr:hypothetical protein [Anaerolineales bacterium]